MKANCHRSLLAGCLTGLLFTVPGSLKAAVEVSLNPAGQTVQVGSPFSLLLAISGLGDGVAPSLGTFDVDVSYDSSALQLESLVLGDGTLGDQLDLFGIGAISEVDSSVPGTINLFELSLDLASDLNSLQAPDFTLANLSFTGLSVGTTALSLTLNSLGDADGFPLDATTQGATVELVAVPEVSAAVPVSLALAGLVAARGLMPWGRRRG
jgi:hypothetical protein